MVRPSLLITQLEQSSFGVIDGLITLCLECGFFKNTSYPQESRHKGIWPIGTAKLSETIFFTLFILVSGFFPPSVTRSIHLFRLWRVRLTRATSISSLASGLWSSLTLTLHFTPRTFSSFSLATFQSTSNRQSRPRSPARNWQKGRRTR